jgi:hypothetical protein
MPIDTTCPHCKKQYRLKDELVGKTVKCSGAECRKVFLITASANGTHSPAKPADSVQAKIDAEKLAAELFADDPDQKPVAERQIEVTCEVCEHKWSEPASKIGKMVLCPECKHRQRIPEPKQKKLDWRDATGGRRLAEKGPELPKELADQQMTGVSIEALKKGGAIAEPEVEPRSLKEKLTIVALAVAFFAAIGIGGWWLYRTRSDGKESQIMADAVKEAEAIKDDGPLPKGQPPLLRGVLNLAAGEFSIRLNEKKGMSDAMRHFGEAQQQLGTAPRSLDRDVIYGELAVALLGLGGTEEEVKAETRIGWSPHQAKFAPAGNAQVRFVQIELRKLLTDMQQKGVEFDLRVLAVRRLTRELVKKGQPDLLFEIAKQGFTDPEWPEAQSQMLLEAARAGVPADKVTTQATQIPLGGDLEPAPLTLPALYKKLGLPDLKPPKVPSPPQAGVQMDLRGRIVYSQIYAIDNRADEAMKLSSLPVPPAERIQTLMATAELAADPNPALDAAVELVNKDGKAFDRTKALVLYRLVRVACDAGQAAKADVLAKAIQDDGLREWAVSEALRTKWAAGKSVVPTSEAPKPAAAASLRVGNAWGCLGLARHNAAQGGGSDATKEYDGWISGELKGFGYAGLALGLQDRK